MLVGFRESADGICRDAVGAYLAADIQRLELLAEQRRQLVDFLGAFLDHS